jgi:hypothetical protein
MIGTFFQNFRVQWFPEGMMGAFFQNFPGSMVSGGDDGSIFIQNLRGSMVFPDNREMTG